MAHYVTCIYCKQKFDRDKVDTYQVSARRYAHIECHKNAEQNKTQEEKDYEALEKYIMDLLEEPYINPRVKKQIKDYKEHYNYSYSGMLKTLIWFYDIKGNSKEKANGGIGIIPYVYKNAYDYYYHLYLAKLANEEKDIEQYKPMTKEISIFSPRVDRKPPKLFDMEDED